MSCIYRKNTLSVCIVQFLCRVLSRPGEFACSRPSLLYTSRLIKRVDVPVQIDGLETTTSPRAKKRRYSPHVTGHDGVGN